VSGVVVADIMKNNILATIDVTACKSLKDLYGDLLAEKKDVFADDERIVIVYKSSDQKKLIDELLIAVDIPEFFVIFEQTDSTVESAVNFSFSDSHCIYPWSNIEIRNNGSFSPCCKFTGAILDDRGQELNIQNSTLNDAYLSKFMEHLRKDFIEGKRPGACKDCWINEASNKESSLRQTGKYKFRNIYYTLNYRKEDLNNLRSLDLKLGNTCNLSCRICTPIPSSKIATLEFNAGRLSPVEFKNIKKSTRWSESDEFWCQFLPIAGNLVELDILGGEPLLVKSHYNFLKKLIELDIAKNISLDYASNGTVYSEEYLNLWKHFKEAKISFSIDDIGKRFEYQRNGANWESVVENIKKYNSITRDNFITEVYPTINIQNVYYLPELIDWIYTVNFDHISYSFVHNPNYLSIENLTDQAKILVLNKLVPFSEQHPMIKASIQMIRHSNSLNTDFLAQMQIRDSERGQNFRDHHTDIAKAMGYA